MAEQSTIGGESTFSFHSLGAVHLPSEIAASLEKWDLAQATRLVRFRFDEPFEFEASGSGTREAAAFAADLFNSAAFRQLDGGQVLLTNRRNGWGVLGGRASEVKVVPLLASITSFDFFDRLFANGIVNSKTNHIKKCIEEHVDGVAIGDELRKLIALEDSENYCLFNESDRRQLLFRLFARMCVGGGMCQYEDEITPVFAATKQLYKELVSVRRNKSTQAVEVSSHVFEILATDAGALFPNGDSAHNMCLVSIDAQKRQVTFMYSAWVSFW